jgi:SAM-dependent methyltransferase
MVHALQEAHRVLKPNGILIDLRPTAEHRRLGLGEGRSWRPFASLHEVLDDDHAADAAVAEVLRRRYFRRERSFTFQLDRVMDTPQELRAWMADLNDRKNLAAHAALLKRFDRMYAQLEHPPRITVRGPLRLAVLRKLSGPS